MTTLQIVVSEKIATYKQRCGDIICGNSDYVIEFTFDEEWDEYPNRVARFIWNGKYKDVEFTGDTCAVPIIQNTDSVKVGIYAGQLQTTTSAVIGCRKSILCGGEPLNSEDEKYYISEAIQAAERAEASADRAEAAVEGFVGVNVVQTTGDREDAVMSQKAVTDELKKFENTRSIGFVEGETLYFANVTVDGETLKF